MAKIVSISNSMGDKSRLVEIRDEYITLLVDALAKPVSDSLNKLVHYEDGRGKIVWVNFQKRLPSVRQWNSIKIKDEVDKIVLRCPHVRKLLTAVMFAFVKVMTHMHNDTPPINLEVPTLEKFVHTVFDNTAEFFYYNPMVWEDDDQRRQIITRVIVRACKRFLPMEDILQAFLGSGIDAPPEEEPEPESEPDEPEETLTFPVPQAAPIAAPVIAPEVVAPVVAPEEVAPVVAPAAAPPAAAPAAAPVAAPAAPANAPAEFFSDADDDL